jgi:hypothetical protein
MNIKKGNIMVNYSYAEYLAKYVSENLSTKEEKIRQERTEKIKKIFEK